MQCSLSFIIVTIRDFIHFLHSNKEVNSITTFTRMSDINLVHVNLETQLESNIHKDFLMMIFGKE